MRLPVIGELSLATKLVGLFGLAVAAVALLALILPFARMQALVDTGQRETARALHDAWAAGGGIEPASDDPGGVAPQRIGDAVILELPVATLRERSREDWRFAEILRAAETPRDPAAAAAGSPEEVFLDDWED